jgi:hypothetical protein
MEHNLVTVETFRLSHRAHMLKAHLEEAGIECFVSEESVLTPVDGVRVMVDNEKLEEATAIYKQMEEDFPAENQED